MIKEVTYQSLEAQIHNVRFWVCQIDPEQLKNWANALLNDTHFKVLKFSEHYFPKQGYTAFWLLSESHLAIHTFPQNGWTYFELSGCNKDRTMHFKQLAAQSNQIIKWEKKDITTSLPD